MASSRWKRFAFFDRHTLTIPPEVLEDVVARSTLLSSSLESTTTTLAAAADPSLSTAAAVATTAAATSSSSSSSSANPLVSLVVTTAGLPMAKRMPILPLTRTTATTSATLLSSSSSTTAAAAATSSSSSSSDAKNKSSTNNNNNSTSSNPLGCGVDHGGVGGGATTSDVDQAIHAMWSSLVTCSSVNYENAVVGEEILSSIPFPNHLRPYCSTTTTTNTTTTMTMPGGDHAAATATAANTNTGTTTSTHSSSQPSTHSKSTATSATTTTTTTGSSPPIAMDGLVLAFLSSPQTDLVHCVDVTVRCNPPLPPPTMTTTTTAASGTQTTDANATATTNKPVAAAERELEDMDGWRGYFGPFRSTVTITTTDTGDARIRDLAVCRIGPATTMTTTTTHSDTPPPQQQQQPQPQHSAVHLACLSSHKCVIWEDPHLHLSCKRPFMTTSKPTTLTTTTVSDATATKVWHLQASSSTSHADGEFTSVSLLPGIVAIGTSKGAVLVYAYNPYATNVSSSSSTSNKPSAEKSHSTTTTAAATNNATNQSAMSFRRYLRIPPPASSSDHVQVVSVKLCESNQNNNYNNNNTSGDSKTSIFVVYNRQTVPPATTTTTTTTAGAAAATTVVTTSHSTETASGGGGGGSPAGICCYEMPTPHSTNPNLSPIYSPSARHDLDGRFVASPRLVDAGTSTSTRLLTTSSGAGTTTTTTTTMGVQARLTVARPDGLYTFSPTERVGVSPIDGSKLTVAMIPPAVSATWNPRRTPLDAPTTTTNTSSSSTTTTTAGGDESSAPTTTAAATTTTTLLGYTLLASTDEKSGRDAVDVYDSTNKLVAFHLLLSPGHCALRAAGVSTMATTCSDGSIKGGRSSALVLTSGGSLVTLTEKRTTEKVDLLVKKNLYSAAVVVAYSDPSFPTSEISVLYRRYAEHLYRKGDLIGAVDQYIHTIGSLESSHVIFRFLDAPKIPLLVKYLNKLRERGHATPVHDELLRTCYLKLNDAEAAEAIASSSSTVNRASLASVLSNLTANPKEALSIICALEAPEAVDILVIHGASLARVLPQATAGVVIALCVGTFSPRSLADSSNTKDVKEMIQYVSSNDGKKVCEPYPVELFASAFIEQPKMLRLILAHCNRSKCPLTPTLRRTLLELTLEEWNLANRTGDTEALKLRHKEAVVALTDSHARDIGEYDALVICQMAGFEDGQLLLYERLQMTPMLLERYAKDGSEKARRQMMAMCQTDPEILADVLGYFVTMASERLNKNHGNNNDKKQQMDSEEYAEETEELLDDIQATLALARRQGASPPVRIARILAGEGTGQFSPKEPPTALSSGGGRRTSSSSSSASSVPLSVALEYLGSILEESRVEGDRLKAEVEEYNDLCNSMEREIESLLRTSRGLSPLLSSSSSSSTAGGGDSLGPGEQQQQQQPSSLSVGGLRSLNIDELYSTIRQEGDYHLGGAMMAGVGALDASTNNTGKDPSSLLPREAFWREMDQSEGADSLDTIARFFAKGVIH
ncbi:hypothetical protein ACA910_021325 [Epithemia clementina (nom. ined.)]